MFSYLRYFSIISAVIVSIAAVALGYYFRDSAGKDLSDLVIKNNRVLVQGFINNVWKDHEMVQMLRLFRQHQITPENWNRYRGYKENYESFSRDVFKYFEEMPVVHVTIYDSNGGKLLSLNQSKILEKSNSGVRLQNPGVAMRTVQRAVSGSTASNILQEASFQIADGSRKNGTVVQTAVPIMSDRYVPLLAGAGAYDKESNIEGMVEIYYDITRQWEQLYEFQYVGTGAVIAIFLLLIGALIVVAAKAEGIIARQHETNLELAAQAAAAETENENKSQFLASISHELRTPLNAIIGFSEIIKNETMGALGNAQYKDYIRDIHNSGVHLLSLINDILDYSKAEAGKLELLIEEVDVTKLIHASMRLVTPRAEHAKVTLHAEVPSEHYIVHTDGKKVKQILLNLLSNAVKFTPEGGNIKVTLWQDVMENSISIEVTDSGIGIAPKDISKALSPFGQVDSALSRKYEGTGLGLPLTKKFVEIMGGTFEIESEEGKGTSIRFSLPLNTPIPETGPAKEAPQESKTMTEETAAAIAEVPSTTPAEEQPAATQEPETTPPPPAPEIPAESNPEAEPEPKAEVAAEPEPQPQTDLTQPAEPFSSALSTPSTEETATEKASPIPTQNPDLVEEEEPEVTFAPIEEIKAARRPARTLPPEEAPTPEPEPEALPPVEDLQQTGETPTATFEPVALEPADTPEVSNEESPTATLEPVAFETAAAAVASSEQPLPSTEPIETAQPIALEAVPAPQAEPTPTPEAEVAADENTSIEPASEAFTNLELAQPDEPAGKLTDSSFAEPTAGSFESTPENTEFSEPPASLKQEGFAEGAFELDTPDATKPTENE